jgi:hypothetical protein
MTGPSRVPPFRPTTADARAVRMSCSTYEQHPRGCVSSSWGAGVQARARPSKARRTLIRLRREGREAGRGVQGGDAVGRQGYPRAPVSYRFNLAA